MRILFGKHLQPLHHPFNRRSSQVAKSDKVDNIHDDSHNTSCRLPPKEDNELIDGGKESIGEAASDTSSAYACDKEAITVSEDSSEGHFFSIGQKRLFSLASISISSDELSCVSTKKEDSSEFRSRQVDDYDSESETTASSISTTTSDNEADNSQQKPEFQLQRFLRLFKKAPTNPSFPSLPALKASAKRFSRKASGNGAQCLATIPSPPPQVPDPDFMYCFQSSWKNFTLSELRSVTDNFSEENLIAEGGNSSVYKGTLDYGQLVAIKRLKGSQEETTSDYLSELGILVHVKHPNIANVIGYGVEDGMYLVLPLSPYGSLDTMLKGQKEQLSWSCRYKIAVGVALGLSYLHEGCQRRIIHRDIKAANILLTEDFEPQICDFGLAKWLPEQWTHLTVTQYEGTFGYLPPEYFLHGIVDEKTDVYSYGVVLLEIITGRPAIDESHNSVVMWAKPFLINKNIDKLVDPSLLNDYNSEQLDRMITIASLCIHQTPSERPQMSKVATMLQGEEGILQGKGKYWKRPPILMRSSHLATRMD